MAFDPAVIPVPSWVLDDNQLEQIASVISEVCQEVGGDDGRGAACLEAIGIELAKRGRPIKLEDFKL